MTPVCGGAAVSEKIRQREITDRASWTQKEGKKQEGFWWRETRQQITVSYRLHKRYKHAHARQVCRLHAKMQ